MEKDKTLMWGLIAIVAIIFAVAIYGFLAKKRRSENISAGVHTVTHQGMLSWLGNWFQNLTIGISA